MHEMIASSPGSDKSPTLMGKNAFFTVLLLAAALAVFLAYNAWLSIRPAPAAAAITTSELQERYGIHVNLLGVTAAGGMVDLRLKMVDGEKAAALLDEPANFPVLVTDNGTVLKAATDSQVLRGVLGDGGNLFLLFPNSRNAVHPGMKVMIRFGDFLVGPIDAR
jgi:hypothetical protein